MHTVESKAKSPKGNAKQDFPSLDFLFALLGRDRASARACAKSLRKCAQVREWICACAVRGKCSRGKSGVHSHGPSLVWKGDREKKYLRERRGVSEIEFCGQFQMTGRESFEWILFVGYTMSVLCRKPRHAYILVEPKANESN